MCILSIISPDNYDYIYFNYIIELFKLVLRIPEILYFGYIILFIIQYLIIEKEAKLKGILETIIFLSFVLIPSFYNMIERYRKGNEEIIENV